MSESRSHYVDVPLDEPAYDSKWSADDLKKGCVVDKIHEFKAVLKDKSKPVEARRGVPCFIALLAGDFPSPYTLATMKAPKAATVTLKR